MSRTEFAFDKSMRRYDADGRLHVDMSNISKAQVSPYLGSEIPNGDLLGLNPTQIYMLYRDPQELAKGAPTFRNLPLLSEHVPVNVDEPRRDLVVGSIGSDVEFVYPFLRCSLSIWDAPAIAGIESNEQAELSSAYRYRADMTPGIENGVKFDGVMRDIVGNHVALVSIGRAGPDVVVCDSQPSIFREVKKMPAPKRVSRAAVAVAGALKAYLLPKLAQDAALGSLLPTVATITAKNFAQQKPTIVANVKTLTAGKLAQDADLEDLNKVLDALQGGEAALMAGDDLDMSDDEDDEEDDPENPGTKRKKVKPAMDTPPPTPGTPAPPTKAAMDAAIATAAAAATAAARKDAADLYTAREDVAPLVGKVALDSAEAVYRFALDHAKVDHADVHASALRPMVKLVLQNQQTPAPRANIALDSKSTASVVELFPNLSRFKHA